MTAAAGTTLLVLCTGCRIDRVNDPRGWVERADYVIDDGVVTGIDVSGWAYDPNAPSSAATVTLYVANSEGTSPNPPDASGIVRVTRPPATPTATPRVTTCRAVTDGPGHRFSCLVPLPGDAATRPQHWAYSDVVAVVDNIGKGNRRVLNVIHLGTMTVP